MTIGAQKSLAFSLLALFSFFFNTNLNAQGTTTPANPGGSDTYVNFLTPRIADPWMIKMGEFFYLFGTASPGDQSIDWTPIWKSRDMVNWSGPTLAYQGTEPHYWAGDGYHYRGKYYLILTCGKGADENHHYKLLQAPTPEGPYTLYEKMEDFKRLDPGIFVDSDGQSYLMADFFIAPLSADWKTIGEWTNHAFGDNVREGPFMIKHNNRYNMFRANNNDGDTGYQMFMGYSDEMLGDYTPFEENPVYDGTHRPGHGGFTASPDGTEMWLTGHYWDAVNTGWRDRWLMIEHWGGFNAEGWPNTVYESFEELDVPSRVAINANIATGGKPINASSFAGVTIPSKATDNKTKTKWIPENENLPVWLELDLSGEFKIKEIETIFISGGVYQYKIEGSYDKYNWTMLADRTSNTQASATHINKVFDDSYYRYIRITITSIPGEGTAGIREFKVINDNHDQFTGYSAPITVQAQDFDASSGNILIENTQDVSGSKNALLKRSDPGDWMLFNNVSINETAIYDIEFRVSTPDITAEWSLYDGNQLIATETIGRTGFWQAWQSVISFDVELAAGDHNFKVVLTGGRLGFNYLNFYKVNRNNDNIVGALPYNTPIYLRSKATGKYLKETGGSIYGDANDTLSANIFYLRPIENGNLQIETTDKQITYGFARPDDVVGLSNATGGATYFVGNYLSEDEVNFERKLNTGQFLRVDELDNEGVDINGNGVDLSSVFIWEPAHVQVITALNETAFENVIVYPNPIDDHITIGFNSHINKSIQATLMTVNGVEIGSWEVKNDVGYDVTNLTAGFYFLKLREGSNQTIVKLMK